MIVIWIILIVIVIAAVAGFIYFRSNILAPSLIVSNVTIAGGSRFYLVNADNITRNKPAYLGQRSGVVVPGGIAGFEFYDVNKDEIKPEAVWIWKKNTGDCQQLSNSQWMPTWSEPCNKNYYNGTYYCGDCPGAGSNPYARSYCNYCRTNDVSPYTSITLQNEATGNVIIDNNKTTPSGVYYVAPGQDPALYPKNYPESRLWPVLVTESANVKNFQGVAIRLSFDPSFKGAVYLSNGIYKNGGGTPSLDPGGIVLDRGNDDKSLYFIQLIPPV